MRVTDFGVARDEDGSLTLTGEVLGTAGYLAPEQARGERCSPATDCYALAVVARELLTGRRDGVLPRVAEGVVSKGVSPVMVDVAPLILRLTGVSRERERERVR